MATMMEQGMAIIALEVLFDEDDDMDEIVGAYWAQVNQLIVMPRGPVRVYVPRSVGYVERTVPEFLDVDFRMHYRVGLDIYQLILENLGPELLRYHGGGKERHSPQKQILVFLSFMANSKESMRQIGLYFGLGNASVHAILRNVCHRFNRRFIGVVRWPDIEEQQEISREFYETSGLRGIVGVLDGSHIRLSNKLNSDNDYINRKGFASVQLQVVCDHRMLIRNLYAGWPGCTHDARVYRNSSLFQILETNQVHEGCYIIADSAYPLQNNLIPPFKHNGHLNHNQRRFNRALSSARQTVERSLGHLKGRFRRLQELTLFDIESNVKTIVAGCILCNMCILNGDVIEEYIEVNEDDHPNQFVNMYHDRDDGVLRRMQLMNELP